MTETGEKRWIAETQGDVAKFFDVSVEHLRRDWRARGMPGKRGEYDLHEIYLWMKATFQRHRRGSGEPEEEGEGSPTSLKQLEREKVSQEIRRITNANDLAEGLVVKKEDVLRDLAEWALRLRAGLQAVPDRIMSLLPPELKAPVRQQVESAIETLIRQEFSSRAISDTTIRDAVLDVAQRIANGESLYEPVTTKKKKARRKSANRPKRGKKKVHLPSAEAKPDNEVSADP